MSVSIVIPTFGRADLLRRLLTSIHAQTYPHYEVIVVDDCSPQTDDYERVVSEFSPRLNDFTFLRNDSNRGAPFSRNRGIRQAKYELVALVDDDDEWLPEKLARQVAVFAQSPPEVGLVYTWTDVVEDGQRRAFYRSQIEGVCLGSILTECFIPSPSVMVLKQAVANVGMFDEKLPSCQDWDLWTRLCAAGYQVRVVREALTLYHKQTSNSIGSSRRAREGYVRYYRKHFWSLARFGKWRHLAQFARMLVRR